MIHDTRKQQALNELVQLFVKAQNPWVSGRAFRRALVPIASRLDDQIALAKSLVPDLAEHNQANPNDDLFRPTMIGLLESLPWTARVVELTLTFLREKFHREPDFRSYTWEELSDCFSRNLSGHETIGDFPHLSVLHILDVSGLGPKWYGEQWGAPDAIERLVSITTVDDLLLWQGVTQQKLPGSTDAPRKVEHLSMKRIFVGHGQSAVWRELKDFLQDRLALQWEEFNREATAGRTTHDRLKQMLDSCSFAFLVLTGDDEIADGARVARANVIHELGLFQGKLGFEKAIVLLEEGCAEFSNIVGLTQVRFPRNQISASFEEVRRVLERENQISP